jgi:hypothetical protein
MANKLAELKSALGAGARANKYRINFSVPAVVATTSNLQNVDTLCKASNFPGMTIGAIEVFNQGRKLLIPGDTTYTNTWALTFYNTEDHAFRKDMIAWMKAADHFQNNQHSGNPGAIMTELSVEQLDSAGNPTAKYTFHNVFVSEIGELAVGDDTADTIQEFDVTFSFSDWVVGDGEFNAPAAGNAASGNDLAG